MTKEEVIDKLIVASYPMAASIVREQEEFREFEHIEFVWIALGAAFAWGSTSQGHGYWTDLVAELQGKEI